MKLLALFILFVCCLACRDRHAKQLSKKIFYINSYHKGYPPSDEIIRGMESVLAGKEIQLETFFLDTKNKPGNIQLKVEGALKSLKNFQPGVVVVSDDAAVNYLVVPYLKDTTLPVVFCGVNWSAQQYDLPLQHITGMLEVLPLRENLLTMKTYFPEARQLLVLSEQSLSEEKNRTVLDTLYKNCGFTVQYVLVNNFEEWKTQFILANKTADIIYLPTNGAIKGWDIEAAKQFVEQHIQKPVITCDDFMMPYCVYGLTKVPAEQGRWAAGTAVDILNGKPPGSIAVTKNREVESYLNEKLAAKIGFNPADTLRRRSHIIH